MPRESLMAALIRSRAERLASDPRLPDPLRLPLREAAAAEMRELVGLLAGERVRVGGGDVRLTVVSLRRDGQRQHRIAAALRAGQAVADVARAEGVSERYVRRVRAALVHAPALPE